MIIGKRQALLWGPMFLFIVAFVLHVSQIYVMFAALGMLAPVSYLLGRRKLAGIVVSRHGKSVMTAGERGTVTLTVRNEGSLRQFFFAVRDHLPDGLESPQQGEVLVADLPPGAEQRYQYTLLARRRGVYRVGPPTLHGSDYLGLYQFSRRCGPAAELLVYPRAIPIPNLWPRSLRGRAPHSSRRRVIGPSTEFYGVRDYYPGDDMRRVAWKTSARRGKLTVVETQQTESTEAVVVVDLAAAVHAGEGERSTVEYAATLAASLIAEALSRGCHVGLIAVGSEDHSVPVSASPRQQLLILEALARMRPDGSASLGTVLTQHERFLPPGCTVAVISPAADGEAEWVTSRLRALGHATVWFALDAQSFRDGGQTGADASPASMEGLMRRVAAQGARVVSISGAVSLETNLWRRGARGRRN